MIPEDRLREAIRKHIDEMLDEMTTTGNVAGYLTPNAFAGDKHSTLNHSKKMAKSLGYTLTKKGEEDSKGDKLTENYYAYRNDPTSMPHQKIGKAISEVSRQIRMIERVIRMNGRLQKESGIGGTHLWKRTASQMLKLEGKLIELASKLREMRG